MTTDRRSAPLDRSARFRRRLVGREPDRASVRSALDEGRRVVTLTGIGGIGKTRLALEIAGASAAPRSLVVGLGHTRTEDDVVAALTRRLPWPGEARDSASLTEILEALGPTLLVLDEVECVVDIVAERVAEWGAECPDLQVLCTSRVPLGVLGESVVCLDRLSSEEAFELLVLCATEHDHRFDIRFQSAELRALAERLEGIPLAVELASGWLATLTPRQLIEQLAVRPLPAAQRRPDLPARHRSMEASLALSWSLLSPAERSVLAQASVLRVSFRFEEAEALFELPDAEPVVGALNSLRSCGLVRVVDARSRRRFTLFETIRQFVLTKLDPATRVAVEVRHTRTYLGRFADLRTHRGLCETITRGVDEAGIDEVPHLEAVMHRQGASMSDRVRAAVCIILLVARAGHIATLLRAFELADRLRDGVAPELLARVDVAMVMARWFIGGRPALVDPERIEDPDLHQIWLVQRAQVQPDERWRLLDAANRAARQSAASPTREFVSSMTRYYQATELPFAEAQRIWEHESRLAVERGFTRPYYGLQFNHAQALMLMGYPERAWSIVKAAQAADDLPNDVALVLVPLGIRLSMMNGDFEATKRLLHVLRFDLDAVSSTHWAMSLTKLELLYALVCGEWTEARAIADRVRRPRWANRLVEYSSFLAQVGVLSMVEGDYQGALSLVTSAERAVAPTPSGPLAVPSTKLLAAIAHALLDQPADARALAIEGASRLGDASSHWARTVVAVYGAVAGALSTPNDEKRRALEHLLGVFGDLRARSGDLGLWDRLAQSAPVGMTVAEPPNGWTVSPKPYPAVMAIEGLIRRQLARRPPSVSLVLHPRLSWARVGSGKPVDLSRLRVGNRLLEALVRQSQTTSPVVPVDDLLTAGWPGDRSPHHVLTNRLWVALSNLRRLGLGEVIEREGNGYRIRSTVQVVYEDVSPK